MGLSSSKEIPSIERNLPIPSNCRSWFPFPTNLLTVYVISFSQKGADAFYTGKIAENVVSGELLSICLFSCTCAGEVVHLVSNQGTRWDHNLAGPQRLQSDDPNTGKHHLPRQPHLFHRCSFVRCCCAFRSQDLRRIPGNHQGRRSRV